MDKKRKPQTKSTRGKQKPKLHMEDEASSSSHSQAHTDGTAPHPATTVEFIADENTRAPDSASTTMPKNDTGAVSPETAAVDTRESPMDVVPSQRPRRIASFLDNSSDEDSSKPTENRGTKDEPKSTEGVMTPLKRVQLNEESALTDESPAANANQTRGARVRLIDENKKNPAGTRNRIWELTRGEDDSDEEAPVTDKDKQTLVVPDDSDNEGPATPLKVTVPRADDSDNEEVTAAAASTKNQDRVAHSVSSGKESSGPVGEQVVVADDDDSDIEEVAALAKNQDRVVHGVSSSKGVSGARVVDNARRTAYADDSDNEEVNAIAVR
jgi:hypothetical protein